MPFIGELKCIQTNPLTRLPAPCDDAAGPRCRDDLFGHATIETVSEFAIFDTNIDPQKYNAVGLRTAGQNDGGPLLTIGGPPADAEYEPCAEVLVLNHLFDDAVDPISGVPDGVNTVDGPRSQSTLTLVPCTEDFLAQTVPTVTVHFLVYNEFEVPFSFSRLVACQLDSPLSLIDTSDPTRSIWNAAVRGTEAGQTRLKSFGGGVIGSAQLRFCPSGAGPGCAGGANPVFATGGAYQINQAVERAEADFIRIP